MKKLVYYIALAAMFAGCSSTEPLKVQVTPVGQEPAKAKEKYFYALPETVLKVEVTLREERSVRGPYWEYAEKYLGLKDVLQKNSSRWSIWDITIGQHKEMDPQQLYTVNIYEGLFNEGLLAPYLEQGVLLKGTETIDESAKGNGLQSTIRDNYIRYEDLGVSNNFEERTETMYKTIVTDTAFVEVPVQRTVVEQKSSATKAKEAADFLLELRTRRFELLTGEYEAYPDGVAMEATIQKLDQIEASYLSLFTGKTITRVLKRTWFIVPEKGVGQSIYPLDIFSDELGFVPAALKVGQPLEVVISPMGKINRLAGTFTATEIPYNTLIYRIPDQVELKVLLGEEILATHRLSIYQSGSLVTGPLY
jgi:hypothetical protein